MRSKTLKNAFISSKASFNFSEVIEIKTSIDVKDIKTK
jgi:hypothetical protein